jgi:hypothetical protein
MDEKKVKIRMLKIFTTDNTHDLVNQTLQAQERKQQ